MDDAVWPDERAGWWRRTLGLLVDGLCVIVPSVALGALLFAATAGNLQWQNPGLQWQICAAAASVPANLDPPPPADSNETALCRTYSVFGQIGQSLTVARIKRESGTETRLARTYALRSSGETGAHDLSWVTLIALLSLLPGCEGKWGTTPGKRLLGMRVIGTRGNERYPVRFAQVATRYGVAMAGVLIPMGIGLAVVLTPVASGRVPSASLFFVFSILMIFGAVWQLWNAVRIGRRRPAVYDRVARVEVVRTDPRYRVVKT